MTEPPKPCDKATENVRSPTNITTGSMHRRASAKVQALFLALGALRPRDWSFWGIGLIGIRRFTLRAWGCTDLDVS